MSNIVLVGFMGTGKSTIGKIVAEKLGYAFLDSDTVIEEEAGATVAEIFEMYGEQYFRELESNVISRISSQDNLVIATGGGVVLSSQNMHVLGSSGIIICLKAEPQAILKRIGDTSTRPLLKEGNPAQAMEKRLKEREGLYYGDLLLDTTFINPAEAADRIISFTEDKYQPKSVKVNLKERSYEIKIGNHLLEALGDCILEVYPKGNIMIVSNPTVHELWGKALEKGLKNRAYDYHWALIPDGEEYKNLEYAARLYDKALEFKLDRKSLILAFGGGVIGDMAGFVSSTFMRGVPYIQVPTTLLSQVDSSVGGKTAVNHSRGKNLIGSFCQPKMVIADTALLTTLPGRELSNGIAEVIKYGVICNSSFFDFLEAQMNNILALDQKALAKVVEVSCGIKAGIVEQDEREEGIRALLNYGHTIAHGLEASTGYSRFRHGEAVALGMEGAAHIAVGLGIMADSDRIRQRKLLNKAGLPLCYSAMDGRKVLEAIASDKKFLEEKPRLVLPRCIGSASIFDSVTYDIIESALKHLSDCRNVL